MILAHRSKLSASDICKGLEINASYLSRLYKSELLTENIRRRAARLFQVPESVFRDGEVGEGESVVNEPLHNAHNQRIAHFCIYLPRVC